MYIVVKSLLAVLGDSKSQIPPVKTFMSPLINYLGFIEGEEEEEEEKKLYWFNLGIPISMCISRTHAIIPLVIGILEYLVYNYSPQVYVSM